MGAVAVLVAIAALRPFDPSPIADHVRQHQHEIISALAEALTHAHGAPPVQIRTLGGTVPIAPFIEALGFPAALVPIVNFDNNQHEENENLRLGHLFDGIVSIAAILSM